MWNNNEFISSDHNTSLQRVTERKNRVCVSFYEWAYCPFEHFCEHAHHYDELTSDAQKLLLESVSVESIPSHFLESSKIESVKEFTTRETNYNVHVGEEIRECAKSMNNEHANLGYQSTNMQMQEEHAIRETQNNSCNIPTVEYCNTKNITMTKEKSVSCNRETVKDRNEHHKISTEEPLYLNKEYATISASNVDNAKKNNVANYVIKKETNECKNLNNIYENVKSDCWKSSPNYQNVDMLSFQMHLPIRCRYPHPHLPPNVSYYQILEMPQTATTEKILEVYQLWARSGYKAMKNVNPERADKVDCLIVEARNVLGNEQLRKEYDASLLLYQQIERENAIIWPTSATSINDTELNVNLMKETANKIENLGNNNPSINSQEHQFGSMFTIPNTVSEQRGMPYEYDVYIPQTINTASDNKNERKITPSVLQFNESNEIDITQVEFMSKKGTSEITPESQYRTQGQSLDSSTLRSSTSHNSKTGNKEYSFLASNFSTAEFSTHPFSTCVLPPWELCSKRPIPISSDNIGKNSEHSEYTSPLNIHPDFNKCDQSNALCSSETTVQNDYIQNNCKQID